MTNRSDVPHMVEAAAPGKLILFGEHAINRGQPAIATSVGVYARCRVTTRDDAAIVFRSDTHEARTDANTMNTLRARIDDALAAGDYAAIRHIAATDYFAPASYILAHIADLPAGLAVEWQSDIPSSSGMGSGGAAFVAMVAAVSVLLPQQPTLAQRVRWAHRGDVVAHGGVASPLDTQTSSTGGVIQLEQTTQDTYAVQSLPYAPGLRLVVGNTNVVAATSAVNGGVQRWLAEQPRRRMTAFQSIGTLARYAVPLIERGEWAELGQLMNLNQLILREIGVSTPPLECLIDAALDAGAFGAKVSGSGGGGIMIALVVPATEQHVLDAITAAGGTAMSAPVGVAGAAVVVHSSPQGATS